MNKYSPECKNRIMKAPVLKPVKKNKKKTWSEQYYLGFPPTPKKNQKKISTQ